MRLVTCMLVCVLLQLFGAVSGKRKNPPISRMIVKYRDEATAGVWPAAWAGQSRRHPKAEKYGRVERVLALGAELLLLGEEKDEADVETMAKTLAAEDADVEYAGPDYWMHHTSFSDPRYSEQWGFFDGPGARVDEALRKTPRQGGGVVVAVVDTGITSHPDLNGQILPGYDFISDAPISRDNDGRDADPSDEGDWGDAHECGIPMDSSWHGTHVAGTIAANANDMGVVGVAPRARILPVRVLGKCGGGSLSDITDGILWAAGLHVSGVPANPNPAQVINLSLGAEETCSQYLQSVITKVTSIGVTVVVSAGNENKDASLFAPGNCASVITVGASNHNGDRAWYSNYGRTIYAPGGETHDSAGYEIHGKKYGILSTLNDGLTTLGAPTYGYYQGTSMAAPHVSGVVALMLSIRATLTPSDVLHHLTKLTLGCCDGGSRLHAGAAVDSVLELHQREPLVYEPQFAAYPEAATLESPSPPLVSELYVTHVGKEVPFRLTLDISHTQVKDLHVILFGPDGTSFDVWDGQGGNGVSIKMSLDFVAPVSTGRWALLVGDFSPGHVGTLHSWSLDFGMAGSSVAAVTSIYQVTSDLQVPNMGPRNFTLKFDVSHMDVPILRFELYFPGGISVTVPTPVRDEAVLEGVLRGSFEHATSETEGTWTLVVTDPNLPRQISGFLKWWSVEFHVPRHYSTDPGAVIPDGVGSVTSELDVLYRATDAKVVVTLLISHTYAQDLVVTLLSPGGQNFTLWESQGGSSHNVRGTFPISSQVTMGTWTLTVRDTTKLDAGSLDSWSLNF
eukprot:TRINITY_DN6791_c0_g1_i1.p1 TRINITY_DN6791_c0_g1~~TRINITY_DN6791_c0_g1_i1.p1  ORF type:complete len:793 (+),score=23.04 TRINITY_DN6791_c0_g1_i1:81-2459(+)